MYLFLDQRHLTRAITARHASESSLGAHAILLVLSCGGSMMKTCLYNIDPLPPLNLTFI